MSVVQDAGKQEQGSSFHAAMARTLMRSLALYFSRPARLFRPSKVSGWTFLRGLASREGSSLSPQYVSKIIKQQGIFVVIRHFVPPIVINALLGSILWTTYAQSTLVIKNQLPHHPIAVAAVAGGLAGCTQGLIAAPVENVRLLLEGTSNHGNWSEAWKDVFKGTQTEPVSSKVQSRQDARQIRKWMKEVNSLAGRGWNGWAWGCGKDTCGFAAFFAIFEVTRQIAGILKKRSSQFIVNFPEQRSSSEKRIANHFPRIVNGLTLVSGGIAAGLCYEILGRPWDVARKTVRMHKHLQISHNVKERGSILQVLISKIRTDGLRSFFLDENVAKSSAGTRGSRYTIFLRMLGRLGPWGVGFLAWEAFGPGLSP